MGGNPFDAPAIGFVPPVFKAITNQWNLLSDSSGRACYPFGTEYTPYSEHALRTEIMPSVEGTWSLHREHVLCAGNAGFAQTGLVLLRGGNRPPTISIHPPYVF